VPPAPRHVEGSPSAVRRPAERGSSQRRPGIPIRSVHQPRPAAPPRVAMREACLADLVPLWRTVRGQGVTALVTPALDYVGGRELKPRDPRFAGQEELATLGEGLRRFVGSLDDGSTLLFLTRTSTDAADDIAAYEHRAAARPNGALARYSTARGRWLRSRRF